MYGGFLKYNALLDKFVMGTVENGKMNNGITIDRISGNVGINNVSPTSKMDIKGEVNVNNNKVMWPTR